VTAGVLTRLTEADLAAWLAEVRRIAALPDAEALVACDVLVWSILEHTELRRALLGVVAGDGTRLDADGADAGDDWEASLVADQRVRLTAATDRLAALADRPALMKGWEPGQLRQQADLLGAAAAPELHARAYDVARQAEVRFLSATLERFAQEPLTTAPGLTKRQALITVSLIGLRQLGAATPALETRARQALELAARFRSQKKVDEAAVVEAGGNQVKAARLRKEATVLLAQDWLRVFPGEPAPTSSANRSDPT
jgi:hypothetical protein